MTKAIKILFGIIGVIILFVVGLMLGLEAADAKGLDKNPGTQPAAGLAAVTSSADP